MIRIEGLCKSFGSNMVFGDFNFSAADGEIVGITGRSGSGKSTLLRIISALESYDSGCVMVNDSKVVYGKYNVGTQYVFQSAAGSLNQKMKIEELVTEAPVYHGICSRENRHEYFEELMQLVGLKIEMGQRYPMQLSGGELQRIALIRALAVRPSTLLLDEITSSQDKESNNAICEAIKNYCKRNMTSVLFVSHNEQSAALTFDREVRLDTVKSAKFV
ncbi:MAG: ATP-binding cassette domain-containing protein [Eubacteriales bacterium]|nr:ATP-binding cassette domain-containing protein [Eubacteriales bacterium]